MDNKEIKIMIVEDDTPIRNLMLTTLKTHGYSYQSVANGREALTEIISYRPDIMLLDLGLPDIDGVEVIESIRKWSRMPIIVVSARSDDSDKIAALDKGADDYITKPFSVDELMARIRVAQRRILDHQNGESCIFTNGGLRIDYSSNDVTLDGREVLLTPNEYKLLCYMAKNVGKVITHTYLTDYIWGNSLESDIATLRVLMATLRKKLGEKTTQPVYIQTHAGIGYRMNKI